MNSSEFVSILLPCRNEAEFIEKCLDSVVANDYPKDRLELLVLDGMSNDGTRPIVQQFAARYPFIRLVDNVQKITPAALNIGVKEARGSVVMRMDAHSAYEIRYISKCISALRDLSADNVGGMWETVSRNDTFLGSAIILSLSHRFGIGNAHYRLRDSEGPRVVDTVPFFCLRREMLEKVGPFNEALIRGQDMEYSLRIKKAGGVTVLLPDVVTQYYARSDIRSFMHHNWINGVWAILPFGLSDIVPVSPRHLVPLVFAFAMLCGGCWGTMSDAGLLMLTGVIVPYTLLSAAASAQIAVRRGDPRYFLIMPLIFGGLHLAYGFGSLWGLVLLLLRRADAACKRLFDLGASAVALFALLPVLAAIAALVKKSSKGPVFYRGNRQGLGGRSFFMLKFRTMLVDAEQLGGSSTADDDPRITKIGKWLRRYKLDELPQLWNVLIGEMSLVGPRPQVLHDVDKYSEEERQTLSVRPGITDWSSIRFRNEGEILKGQPDPDRAYIELIRPEKIRLQLHYVRNRSFLTDLKILWATLLALAGREVMLP